MTASAERVVKVELPHSPRARPLFAARLLSAGFGLLTLLATAATPPADWRDNLTTKPGSFAPLRPFTAHYRFGWTMFPAAEADFALTRSSGVAKLAVNTKTIGVVRTSWRMDSESVSKMNTELMLPISLRQTEVYRRDSEKTRVDYTPTTVSRIRESTPPHGEPKVKRFEFPAVHDLHSAYQFLRSQRLNNGDVYQIVVYPSTDPYLARVEVKGRGQVKAAGANRKAIQLDLKLWKINKDDLTLETHEKFKRAAIFIGDDADRLLLKIEGEIAVGTVWCELQKVDFGKP